MATLPSSDPSDIANAARCFSSCETGVNILAVRTYLLTQGADRSTPPCVTPTTPGTPTVFQALNNILKISWTQPTNTGSLITSYTVSYGTTSGVYTNTVISHSHSASLTGLISGTQYFFVVTANSFAGCSSAASGEGSGTTTGIAPVCNAGLIFANAWAARVVANGGAQPSAATITAIGNFQCGLIADGLDTQMIVWNAFVSDNFIASLTPQLTSATAGAGGTPSNDPWTNHNFVAGDLNVSGLKGDAATKWLDTGVQAQSPGTFTATDNCGASFYQTAAPTAGTVCGCDNGGNSEFFFLNHQTMFAWQYPGQKITAANVGWTGYISGNVTPVHLGAIYKANSTNPHAALVTGALGNGGLTVPPFNIVVFGFENNTGTSIFSDARLGFFGIHKGLTQANSALFSARVQTLMTALLRQV